LQCGRNELIQAEYMQALHCNKGAKIFQSLRVIHVVLPIQWTYTFPLDVKPFQTGEERQKLAAYLH
jgi:hypothetical protein